MRGTWREFAENLAAFGAVLGVGGAVLATELYGLNHPAWCDRLRGATAHAWQQTVVEQFELGRRAFAENLREEQRR